MLGIHKFSPLKKSLKFLSSNYILKKGKHTRIACASGFWGDTPGAASQLIQHGNVDFIMFDYLSEVTMSLLTAAKAVKPEMGYAPDFVSHAIGPNLTDIKQKGIRIISNAGGMNPHSCASALTQACKRAGVDLKIAVVTGDDMMKDVKKYIGISDMQTNRLLPHTVNSMNAYLGSGPIVECLDDGADIVITGRCTDSSLALGPLIHSLGWKWTDYDLLSCGSLAGHLIECGTQVTGGIFTDWEDSDNWQNSGFPIAEVSDDGSILITKNEGTGGLINRGTVAEQLLYEIGDPRAYVLPDVVCDFTKVILEERENGVMVTGALGKPPTDSFKVCATYLDGFKATVVSLIAGPKSIPKGRKTAQALLERCRRIFKERNMNDFERINVQIIGAEDIYGHNARLGGYPREAAIWISVHHYDRKALQIFCTEIASAATGMAPGLSVMVGGRPKPTPLLRLHSFLVKKSELQATVSMDGDEKVLSIPEEVQKSFVSPDSYDYECQPESFNHIIDGKHRYRLEDLAYTRSGDKGNSCNIGVVARKKAYLPYIKEALTSQSVFDYFQHVFSEPGHPKYCVKRYELEGMSALNFVLRDSLGGGGIASLRTDPQGKAFAQMLLDFEISNMPDINTL